MWAGGSSVASSGAFRRWPRSFLARPFSGCWERWLSAGIAEALITTATGLIIAIPALFVHAYLESRAEGILAEIEARLLDFMHLVRRPENLPGGTGGAGGGSH